MNDFVKMANIAKVKANLAAGMPMMAAIKKAYPDYTPDQVKALAAQMGGMGKTAGYGKAIKKSKSKKYMKKKLAHALMLKIANPKSDVVVRNPKPDVVVRNPKQGVTTMDFKRGTTIYGNSPPPQIKKARDTANKILNPLKKLNLGAPIEVNPKTRTMPTVKSTGSGTKLTATYK